MTGALLLFVAAAAFAASALSWTGRWRSWSRRVFTGPLPLPITLLPGIGFALVGAGLYELGVPAGPLTPLFVIFVALFVIYLWAPSWWGPAWFREEQRAGVGPDLSDPATALSYATLTSQPAGADSRAAVAERFGDREPIRRWKATWIEHEDGGEKPHAGSWSTRSTGRSCSRSIRPDVKRARSARPSGDQPVGAREATAATAAAPPAVLRAQRPDADAVGGGGAFLRPNRGAKARLN